MTTIVQVVQHLQPGGIETMVLDLLYFRKASEKMFIISLEGNAESAITAWPRLAPFADQLIFLNKQPGVSVTLPMVLSRLFKKFDANVIHTHHIGPLLYAGLAARLAGIRCLIHTEHDAWHLNQPRRRLMQRQLIRLVKPLLVADAETVANSMRNHLKINHIHIIRNGIDTERFIPGNQGDARLLLGLPVGKKIIGCSGRLEQVKGQTVLLDALLRLPENVHLALAGTGSTEISLRRQAAALRLSDRVHFLGRVDEMPTFYQALNIFCLPSFNEGYPLSPLEAQACNIPAAVTNVGGSSETLCQHSGQLIPQVTASAIAATLGHMLASNNEPKPRSFVQQHSDVRRMVRAYTALRPTGV